MKWLFADDVMSLFSAQIGIDLGTANTPVFVRGHGICLREPSYVAVNNNTGRVITVGEAAKAMYGRAPTYISVIRPLRDGVIANFGIAYEMLKNLLAKARRDHSIIGPRVVVGIPSDVTQVEQRAVREAALLAGARTAYLVEQPFAAAVGAGLPVKEAVGSMVVDIGGGTTEVAVIALGGIVKSHSLRIAGDEMDEAILNYVKRVHGLLIGERTAEEIKIRIGSAYSLQEELMVSIRGRDIFTGLPRVMQINSAEIRTALAEQVNRIMEAVRSTLEQTPPELVGDIIEHGIVLTGGGSLLAGLELLCQEITGVKTIRAEDPINCVARGTGKLLEDRELLYRIATKGVYKKEREIAV